MAIDLTRFIDVSIIKKSTLTTIGTREIVTLFTSEGTESEIKVITSMTEANTEYPATSFPHTNEYLKVFFANNGAKVEVHEGIVYTDFSIDDITELDDDHIVCAAVSTNSNVETVYAKMKSIATSAAQLTGIHQKILLGRTEVKTDPTSIKNFAVKFSGEVGAEMTMAAYLSRINVYNDNSIYDYAFTKESVDPEEIEDDDYGTIIANNMNVDVYLADAVRNCGGNMKDGSDFTNSFVLIVLHQTLTQVLLNLLTTHIKGNTGISKIYTAIYQELERYVNSGYLSGDKIWTDDDLVKTYNNRQYQIITKGTPITSGYIVKVLPLEALTDADKAERKAPPVYVIIADQYGIRKITINGEVL